MTYHLLERRKITKKYKQANRKIKTGMTLEIAEISSNLKSQTTQATDKSDVWSCSSNPPTGALYYIPSLMNSS